MIAALLQRIASHTRNGGPENIRLERFIEALHDSSSGLTYPAVMGSAFMRKRGYNTEANYIETVCNWRRAGDERGLSSLLRSKYNYYHMLNMILDELMPWHKQQYNFAVLEVNRYVCNLHSFNVHIMWRYV